MNKLFENKKLLILVESPNKVKSVQSIIKSLGYTDITVMATLGHTMEIKDAKSSYNNTGIYPEDNFKLNMAIMPDKAKIVNEIKAAAKLADIVLIASDPDREGEKLGFDIKEVLKLSNKKYYRITYTSITKDAIQAALENPRDFNLNLVEAAEARMIVDKLIGYSLSPVAKTYLGAKSVGRCQSSGLLLVTNKEQEINQFIPETFLTLYLKSIKNKEEIKAKYIGTESKKIDHLNSEEDVSAIKAACKDTDYYISEIFSKVLKKAAPIPFCTATFQQEAATELHLSVKDAMSCAQKLFEGLNIAGNHVGLITYHRTDSTVLAPEFLEKLEKYTKATYGDFESPSIGKKSAFDQDGHEALRVSDPEMTPEKLSGYIKNDLLLKVYRLIWQQTIAAALPAAEYLETNYLIKNKDHLFIYKATTLQKAGYEQVFKSQENIVEAKKGAKINFELDEKLENPVLYSETTTTKPPARYTEATLVKDLQKNGIGRPSTYATIVNTVLSDTRGYCEIAEKHILPTEKGIQLSAFLSRAFSSVISLTYTKELEENLDLIAQGKLSKLEFLTNFYTTLVLAIKNNPERPPAKETKICPLCGGTMVIRRSKFGKLFYGCSNYPTCHGLINIK